MQKQSFYINELTPLRDRHTFVRMSKRKAQLELLKDQPKAYGGELLKKRKARTQGRPLDINRSMHLVLRSSHARLDWSFRTKKNAQAIKGILLKFSERYGVKILSIGNVGNHLHLEIKLSHRYTYPKFIRAVTAAIAMAVTGASRWAKLEEICARRSKELSSLGITPVGHTKKFWDYRPFTRVVIGFKALLTMKNYIRINQLEGQGIRRNVARLMIYTQARAAHSSA